MTSVAKDHFNRITRTLDSIVKHVVSSQNQADAVCSLEEVTKIFIILQAAQRSDQISSDEDLSKEEKDDFNSFVRESTICPMLFGMYKDIEEVSFFEYERNGLLKDGKLPRQILK